MLITNKFNRGLKIYINCKALNIFIIKNQNMFLLIYKTLS